MKNLICLIVIVFAYNLVHSQDFEIIGTFSSFVDSSIDNKVSNYKIYEIDVSDTILTKEFNLNLKLGEDHIWKLHLIENNIRAQGCESYLVTPKGRIEIENNIKTYKGYLFGDPKNEVRLSFILNAVEGYIINGDSIYYIFPLERFSNVKYHSNNILVCNSSNIKQKLFLGDDVIRSNEGQSPTTKSINLLILLE